MMSLGKTLAGGVGVGFVFGLVALVALWSVAPGVYGEDEVADEDELTRGYVEGAWEYYVDRGWARRWSGMGIRRVGMGSGIW